MSVVELSTGEERPRAAWLVLLSPTGALTGVRERPRPWWTLLVVTLLAAVPALVLVSVVDMQDLLLAELKASGRLDEMPEKAITFLKERVAPAMTVGLPLMAALARVASVLIIATLGFAFLRGVSKELSFKACLAAVALGTAPLIVHDVIHALLLAVRDARELDLRNPVLSNPAAWLGLNIKKDPLGAFLVGFDLFQLWATWLMAYGLTVVARTRSALPYALTFGAYTLTLLAGVVGAVIASAS